MPMKWLRLCLCFALALDWAPAQTPRDPDELRVMTLNCYCFPERLTNALKGITWIGEAFGGKKAIDLQRGIQQDTTTRKRYLLQIILREKPDVVCLQECWNGEKDFFRNALKASYHVYENKGPWSKSARKILDDGLMVFSKDEAVRSSRNTVRTFIYDDFEDDENMADKGAVILEFQHNDKPWILVNTHLQSGTREGALKIKVRQVHQLASELRDLQDGDPVARDAQVVWVGDDNEPISYIEVGASVTDTLFDRTQYLLDQANQEFAKGHSHLVLSNDQAVARLAREHGCERVVQVYDLDNRGVLRQAGEKGPGEPWPLGNHWRWFNGTPGFGWAYLKEATDPSGRQVLDHAFVDDARTEVSDILTLRKAVLGDKRPLTGSDRDTYNPDTALSDHAAVIFTLKPRARTGGSLRRKKP
jgi:endonuclease/exonuclease/phosphatase family metal-dependent hydrolase